MNPPRNPILVSWGRRLRTEHGRCKVRQPSKFKNICLSRNEHALIHIILAAIYAMWLPLPIALYKQLQSELLLPGTIFGLAYLFMLVITMTLQTGHIAYITKNPDQQGEYMMATLSTPFEYFVNLLKSIWALFLAIAFWDSGQSFMAGIMFLSGMLCFYYLILLLNETLVKKISNLKPNMYITNIETLMLFIVLLAYLS